jgi:hypothetical protein
MSARQWATGLLGAALVTGSATMLPGSTQAATPPSPLSAKVDPHLGNGLGRLLVKSKQTAQTKRQGGLRIDQEALTIRDAKNRVLIDLTPQSNVDRASYRIEAERLGLVVKSVEPVHGTLEGFAPLSAVRALAALRGTGTISQALRPRSFAGSVNSQGVGLQRVDKVQAKGVDGKGITIGALSDSFDTAAYDVEGNPTTIDAAQDVASGDLPGDGNPRNSTPVAVVEDGIDPDFDTDEGRAMLQIAHDVAPASKLCFATTATGILGYADNIRRLADKSGPCRANVLVDDVVYYDEPMFSDGAISDAVNDVAAEGVHYFSAAGNQGVQQSWNSAVKLVPAKAGLKGTNLDFTDVDPALYDGGLQDMNPGSGVDVAQDVTLGATGGLFDLQWDDPVDLDGTTFGAPIFQDSGEIATPGETRSFTFTPTSTQVGKQVQFRTDAIPSGETDLVLSVHAPDGTNLGEIDTGTSPEVLVTTLSQAGPYTITVSGFDDAALGDFTVDVSPVVSLSKVTTDFNALFFDRDGNYRGAVAEGNRVTGKPVEIANFEGPDKLQMVITRAGTGPMKATRLRNVMFGDMRFDEYTDPFSPAIFGHATAEGATAVAGYDVFRSFLPSFFSSPGGDLPIVFDSAGNRYPKTQTRRVPQVAAAEGGNTTFFTVDNARDTDSQPNFSGTSAAAPHAAAIAALVLQKSGGPKSLSPTAMRSRLQSSAFKHDLDPTRSAGTASGLTVRANGAQGYENYAVPGAMTDPRFFTLSYAGKVPLKSVTFYGESASPTAPGKRNPPLSDGIVFDPRPNDGTAPFRTDGFPFTIGGTSGGLQAQKVKATFSVPGGGESAPGQYRRMTLSFAAGLEPGQALQFGVDRDLAVSGWGGSNEGNGADELGGAVFLPQDLAIPYGMAFVGERTDGQKIYGVMSNRLGSGYTPIDGYGLINAEKAVQGR